MLRGAPVVFIGLMVVSVASGIGVGHWHFSEQLEAKDGEIHRYRVALGIDPASKGALVELNNQELAAKAQSTVAKLRDLSADFDNRSKTIKEQKDAGKLTDMQVLEDEQAVMQQVSQDFDRNLASDADNVRNELRRRLSPEAIAHIVRVPAFWADNGSSIPVTALFKGTGFDTLFIRGLADEIEQMAKLLPDSGKQ